MDAPATLHPTDQTLLDYGLGKLDDASSESIHGHLDSCPDCRQRVAELSGDSFVDRLRGAEGRPAKRGEGTSSVVSPGRSAGQEMPAADSPPSELAELTQYEVIREIGRGGMGVVYLARNTMLDRLEVLKVLNKDMLERRGVVDRFVREMRSAAKLSHANVVGAFAAHQLGHLLVFAMEYVEGEDLAKLVKARGPLPVDQACYFIYQAALGLQHAHEKRMVHRDIKPGNLILSRQGKRAVVKVLDFGLAKATLEEPVDSGLTQEGQMLGTPDYIAPEQTLDAQKADIRADIYSLGCTFYYLLSGSPPFKGASLYDILQAHHSMDARPLNLVRPEVPDELAALVAKMMAKEPGRRFQMPGEVARALTPFFKPAASRAPRTGEKAPPADPPVVFSRSTDATPAPTPPVVTEAATPVTARQGPSQASPEGVAWESAGELSETEPLLDNAMPKRDNAARALATGHGRRPSWLWPAVAAGVSLFGLVAVLLAVISVRTPQGDLVFYDLPEEAVVNVDGGVATVAWPESKGPAKVTVSAGDHNVKVRWNGVEVHAEEVKIAAGQQKPIRVRFEPAVAPRPVSMDIAETNPWPGALALAGLELPFPNRRFLAMTRDCRRIAVRSSTMDERIIEAPDASKVVDIKGPPKDEQGKFLWGFDFSPDGKHLAIAYHGYPVKIWDTRTGEELHELSRADAINIVYSPDGKRLAAAGRNRDFYIWDTATHEKVATLGPFSVVTICVAFSPDGKRLAGGGGAENGTGYEQSYGEGTELRVWDLETGTSFALEGHSMRINGVAFSPDGQRLASASLDKTVKIWDLKTKHCLATFDKHASPVRHVRFSPDGHLVASTAEEKAVRVWVPTTGREVATLSGLPGDPQLIQFSPRGRWIYAGSGSTLKAWETPADSTTGLSTAESPVPAPVTTNAVPPAGSRIKSAGLSEESSVVNNLRTRKAE